MSKIIEIVKKDLYVVAISAILGVACAFFFLQNYNPLPQAKTDLFVAPKISANIQDNYFAQETARNFTDSLVAILESQDFSNQIEKASISARKQGPQVLTITASANTDEFAQKGLTEAISYFNTSVAQQLDSPQLVRLSQDTQVTTPTLNKTATYLAGLILGLAFGTFIIAIIFYLKL